MDLSPKEKLIWEISEWIASHAKSVVYQDGTPDKVVDYDELLSFVRSRSEMKL